MHLKKIILLAQFVLCAQTAFGANVIGYFTNWGIYGDNPYTAQDVPYDNLTHIQYAFFKPEANGDISSFDTYADEQILLGKKIWSPVERNDSTTSLIYLAHKNNVKVLASIGGWTGSSNFPALASSKSSRSNFCSQSRALIERYKFDGIDIDWEYPGYTQHNGTPDDAQNFVLLLEELRDTLDSIDGERQLITLAISGGSFHGKNFLVEQFYQDVDYISIMSYDYTGPWSAKSWHNSPLYSYGSDDNWSLDKAMQYYIARGIPASKFNIGLSFYGKTFADCTGPNQSFSGAGSGDEPGTVPYSFIADKLLNGIYMRHWDETAMVPFCLSNNNEYCSYDDTVSLRMKTEYCIEKGYGGAIIWELKGGKLSDGTQPLLDVVADVLIQPVTVKNNMKLTSDNLFYTRTTREGLSINFHLYKYSNVTLTIYDMLGKSVYRTKNQFQSGKQFITLPFTNKLQNGRYLLTIDAGDAYKYEMFTVVR